MRRGLRILPFWFRSQDMAENNHPLARWRERQEPKVTQEALASKLGVWPLTVWRWENRERTPRLKDAKRISVHTNIPVIELIEAGAAQ